MPFSSCLGFQSGIRDFRRQLGADQYGESMGYKLLKPYEMQKYKRKYIKCIKHMIINLSIAITIFTFFLTFYKNQAAPPIIGWPLASIFMITLAIGVLLFPVILKYRDYHHSYNNNYRCFIVLNDVTKDKVSEIIKKILLENHWRYDKNKFQDFLSRNNRIIYQVVKRECHALEKNLPCPIRIIIDNDIYEETNRVVIMISPKKCDCDEILFLIGQIDKNIGSIV